MSEIADQGSMPKAFAEIVAVLGRHAFTYGITVTDRVAVELNCDMLVHRALPSPYELGRGTVIDVPEVCVLGRLWFAAANAADVA